MFKLFWKNYFSQASFKKNIFVFSLLSALSFCFLFSSANESVAGETSVGVSVGYGDSSSVVYDLSVRYTFDPLFAWDGGAIHPFAEGAALVWDNSDDTVYGGGAAVGLHIPFYVNESFQPFLTGSVGGVMLSENEMGSKDLGSNGQFRTRGAAGVSFGESFRHSVRFEFTHYSNAGLNSTNDGFNTYSFVYSLSF